MNISAANPFLRRHAGGAHRPQGCSAPVSRLSSPTILETNRKSMRNIHTVGIQSILSRNRARQGPPTRGSPAHASAASSGEPERVKSHFFLTSLAKSALGGLALRKESMRGLWGDYIPMALLFFFMAFVNTVIDSLKVCRAREHYSNLRSERCEGGERGGAGTGSSSPPPPPLLGPVAVGVAIALIFLSFHHTSIYRPLTTSITSMNAGYAHRNCGRRGSPGDPLPHRLRRLPFELVVLYALLPGNSIFLSSRLVGVRNEEGVCMGCDKAVLFVCMGAEILPPWRISVSLCPCVLVSLCPLAS